MTLFDRTCILCHGCYVACDGPPRVFWLLLFLQIGARTCAKLVVGTCQHLGCQGGQHASEVVFKKIKNEPLVLEDLRQVHPASQLSAALSGEKTITPSRCHTIVLTPLERHKKGRTCWEFRVGAQTSSTSFQTGPAPAEEFLCSYQLSDQGRNVRLAAIANYQ